MPSINAWGSDDPAEVAKGGTGRASHTAYAVICGGTTTTAAQQSIAGVGTSGQVLTSNGAGALPTFQAAAGGGGGAWVFLSAAAPSGAASVDFESILDGTYEIYKIEMRNMTFGSDGKDLMLRVSTDNGSTYETTSYKSGGNAFTYNSGSFQNGNRTDGIQGNGTATGNSTNESYIGTFLIYNTQDTSVRTRVWGTSAYENSGGNEKVGIHGGVWESTTAVNAVQVIMDSGTISGDVILYGLSES